MFCSRSHAHELRERHQRGEKQEREKLYETAARSSKGTASSSNKRPLDTEMSVSPDEDMSTLKAQLDELLPADDAFQEDQWVAVA